MTTISDIEERLNAAARETLMLAWHSDPAMAHGGTYALLNEHDQVRAFLGPLKEDWERGVLIVSALRVTRLEAVREAAAAAMLEYDGEYMNADGGWLALRAALKTVERNGPLPDQIRHDPETGEPR